MKSLLAATCLAIILTATPLEAAEFKGCYERIYDKAYLKQHRKQDIVKIRLQLGVGKGFDGPIELYDRVDAVFRKTKRYEGNLVECQPDGDESICGIEADGGSFRVTDRGENSIRITNTSYMRFGDDDSKLSVNADGEHIEFRLFQISTGPCP